MGGVGAANAAFPRHRGQHRPLSCWATPWRPGWWQRCESSQSHWSQATGTRFSTSIQRCLGSVWASVLQEPEVAVLACSLREGLPVQCLEMEQRPAHSQKDTDGLPGPPARESADECVNISERRASAEGDGWAMKAQAESYPSGRQGRPRPSQHRLERGSTLWTWPSIGQGHPHGLM